MFKEMYANPVFREKQQIEGTPANNQQRASVLESFEKRDSIPSF